MSGAIQVHPSAMYSVLPPKPVLRPEYKPQIAAITALTNGLESAKISSDVETDSQEKTARVSSGIKPNPELNKTKAEEASLAVELPKKEPAQKEISAELMHTCCQ